MRRRTERIPVAESRLVTSAATQAGSGRAVSRILFRLLRSGENHLSQQPVPETCPLSRTRSEPLLGFLFGLAPDGVFRAPLITRRAVVSYTTFSPLPTVAPCGAMTGGIFSVALSVGTTRAVAARVYPSKTSLGYAASRSMVFGLSSPNSRWKRFSALPKPAGDYREKPIRASQRSDSKIIRNNRKPNAMRLRAAKS